MECIATIAETIPEDIPAIISEPIAEKPIEKAVESIPVDFTKLSIKERAALLPAPSDDIKVEFDAYCERMGYTTEKINSMKYKMSLYDEFMEEYDYRKKNYSKKGVEQDKDWKKDRRRR